MGERWSRAELGAHVDGLAGRHQGDAFVKEIAAFAKTLDSEERALLEQVLLERARREDDVGTAVRKRTAERGWMRRTLARAEARAAELIRRRGG